MQNSLSSAAAQFLSPTEMATINISLLSYLITFNIFGGYLASQKSCDKALSKGIESYLDERWDDCIKDMEEVLSIFKTSQSIVSSCRVRCHYDEDFVPLFRHNVEDLHYYEKMLKRTLCLMDCQKQDYDRANVSSFISSSGLSNLKDLQPYDYLHLCYFKSNLPQQAANAAYTYLLKHPDNKQMRSNLEYYLGLPGVDKADITNYETEEYFALYLFGMKYYEEKEWENTVSNMEGALTAYLASEQNCRALCEGNFDQGWLPDFSTSLSNHFTYCLKCKRRCPKELKPPNGPAGRELLADMYNYLQYSYFKLGQMEEAARSVASYLVVHHFDNDMLENKKYYLSLAKMEMFEPRPEIIQYVYREDYEEKLLTFINKEFYSRMNTDNDI